MGFFEGQPRSPLSLSGRRWAAAGPLPGRERPGFFTRIKILHASLKSTFGRLTNTLLEALSL